jgi:hypothetical protein
MVIRSVAAIKASRAGTPAAGQLTLRKSGHLNLAKSGHYNLASTTLYFELACCFTLPIATYKKNAKIEKK